MTLGEIPNQEVPINVTSSDITELYFVAQGCLRVDYRPQYDQPAVEDTVFLDTKQDSSLLPFSDSPGHSKDLRGLL